MKKFGLFIVFSIALSSVYGQVNTWDIFAKTKFELKFDEKIGENIFVPNFPANLKAMEGKVLTVEGYYVPFAPEDGNYIIISKFPMSQCFFCGGGGPETIAEVNFAGDTPTFAIDDIITVKGKLRLNVEDPDHINFILEQATLIDK